jgi:hypothetical protein
MTAKEKAKQLVELFYNTLPQWVNIDDAKMCALKVVGEIFQVCPYYDSKIREDEAQQCAFEFQFVTYWEEVKVEISKIERL